MEASERRAVLIAGGTSGVGLAAARRFVREGAQVLLAGRSEARGEEAVASFPAEEQGAVRFFSADVRQVASCHALVQECVKAFGRLDVLVNAAGIYAEGAIEEVTEELFDDILATNLKGTYFLCQAAVPELKKTRGSIVNVSSDAGLHGNYFAAAYCASKGGVTLLTRALALELAHTGVRVNAVAPGDLLTPLTERQIAAAPDREAALREMASVYPLGRIGTAEEAAAAICYLASPDAGFITGTTLAVDGGLTA